MLRFWKNVPTLRRLCDWFRHPQRVWAREFRFLVGPAVPPGAAVIRPLSLFGGLAIPEMLAFAYAAALLLLLGPGAYPGFSTRWPHAPSTWLLGAFLLLIIGRRWTHLASAMLCVGVCCAAIDECLFAFYPGSSWWSRLFTEYRAFLAEGAAGALIVCIVFARLIPRRRWFEPETIALVLTGANYLFLFWESLRAFGGCVVCPWYTYWSAYNEPTRLLLAAVALRTGRTWMRLGAAALSAQVALCVVYFYLNPNEIAVSLGYPAQLLFLLQGPLSALVFGISCFRLLARIAGERPRRVLIRSIVGFLAVVAVGYGSSFASYGRCEDQVARWVAHDQLRGEPFRARDSGGVLRALSIFRRMGANVRDAAEDKELTAYAEVGYPHFRFPFLVEVNYQWSRWHDETYDDFERGSRNFACFYDACREIGWAGPWLVAADRVVWNITMQPWAWLSDRR